MKYTMETIANIMNDNVFNNIVCYTQDVYKDYGMGEMWRTIIVKDIIDNCNYQALSPEQHDDIENGVFTLEQVEELIETANKLYGK